MDPLRQQQKSDRTWNIIARAPPFSPVTGTCQLCTTEKFNNIFNPEICSLNSRNELFPHCRHKEKVLQVKHVRKKRKNGLSLSMGNQLSAPLIVLQLFCIICLSTSDNSVDILPNETDCKVLIKTTQTYTNYSMHIVVYIEFSNTNTNTKV